MCTKKHTGLMVCQGQRALQNKVWHLSAGKCPAYGNTNKNESSMILFMCPFAEKEMWIWICIPECAVEKIADVFCLITSMRRIIS